MERKTDINIEHIGRIALELILLLSMDSSHLFRYRKKVLKAKANARKASLINNDIEKGNVEKDEHGAEIESKFVFHYLTFNFN